MVWFWRSGLRLVIVYSRRGKGVEKREVGLGIISNVRVGQTGAMQRNISEQSDPNETWSGEQEWKEAIARFVKRFGRLTDYPIPDPNILKDIEPFRATEYLCPPPLAFPLPLIFSRLITVIIIVIFHQIILSRV